MSGSSIKTNETIKKLDSQLSQLNGEREGLILEKSILEKKLVANKESISEIKKKHFELSKLLSRDVQISEHALLRYCERVLGIDIEEIKKMILTERFTEAVRVVGNGTYPINNFKVRVIDGTIVTVIKD